MNNTAVILIDQDAPRALAHSAPGLAHALALWADATTDPTSERRADLLHDKVHAAAAFFEFTHKAPGSCTPLDVKAWQAELEHAGHAPATVYAMISRVSSFYTWARKAPELAAHIHANPVDLARPKAPRAYQSESIKALDDDQARRLKRTVKALADAGDLHAKRDYAMLLFYLYTGARREEIARLKWRDVQRRGDALLITMRVKGGKIVTKELRQPSVWAALAEYLRAAGRLNDMQDTAPLWTRHDNAGAPGARLSSHSFAKNLKQYAHRAGIGHIHVHQTRHTAARILADTTGSVKDAQEMLGHEREQTTRVYVQRVGIMADRFSEHIAARLAED